MRIELPPLILLIACSVLAGQPLSVTQPQPALLFIASSATVVPLFGEPGAAWTGAPLLSGVRSWRISPDGASALLLTSGQAALVPLSAPDTRAELVCCPSAPDLTGVAWGSTASDVLAWSRSAVYRLRRSQAGLTLMTTVFDAPPDEPVVAAVAAPAAIAAPAADGSSTVLVATAAGLYRSAPEGVRLLHRPAAPLQLVNARDAVYALDSGSPAVLRIDPETGAVTTALDASDGLAQADAAAVSSAHAGWLYLVSRRDQSLQVFDVAARRLLSRQTLDYEPCGIAEQPGRTYLQIETCGERTPLLFVSAAGAAAEPVVRFVPRGDQ